MTSKTKHYLDAIDPLASRFIRGKVRQLVGLAGYREADREDLFHEFALDLLQRKPNFDPAAGTWEAFVIVVCENCFAALLEHRRAEKRSDRREAGSLNDFVSDDDEGRLRAFGDTIPDTQPSFRIRRARRAECEASELKLDVVAVIQSLPPELRHLCELLKRDTVVSAARHLGISRTAAYEPIRELRQTFEAAGLRDYL